MATVCHTEKRVGTASFNDRYWPSFGKMKLEMRRLGADESAEVGAHHPS